MSDLLFSQFAEMRQHVCYLQMLCEESGFFLEIADTIRGFGLTILKGLMELRDGKIMARFLVEVEKIFLFLSICLSIKLLN
jgi:hypothetical protein